MTFLKQATDLKSAFESAMKLRNLEEVDKAYHSFNTYSWELPKTVIKYTYENASMTISVNEFEDVYYSLQAVIEHDEKMYMEHNINCVTENTKHYFGILTKAKEQYDDYVAASTVCNKKAVKDFGDQFQALKAQLEQEAREHARKQQVEEECMTLKTQLWSQENVYPFSVIEQTLDDARFLVTNQEMIMNDTMDNEDKANVWLSSLRLSDFEQFKHLYFLTRYPARQSALDEVPDMEYSIPVTIFGKTIRCIDVYFDYPEEERIIITNENRKLAEDLQNEKEAILADKLDNTAKISVWITAMKLRHNYGTLYLNNRTEPMSIVADKDVDLSQEIKVYGKTISLPQGVVESRQVGEDGVKIFDDHPYDGTKLEVKRTLTCECSSPPSKCARTGSYKP